MHVEVIQHEVMRDLLGRELCAGSVAELTRRAERYPGSVAVRGAEWSPRRKFTERCDLRPGRALYRVQVALSASHSESITAVACFGSRGWRRNARSGMIPCTIRRSRSARSAAP